MDIQEIWEKALRNTQIIRPRVKDLETFSVTHLPYIFLSGSSVNPQDTIVRIGDVVVEKPSIILPENLPQFKGFDFEEDLHINQGLLTNFLLVRGVRFPSFKYENKYSLDSYEGNLDKVVEFFLGKLQKEEDVLTGLLSGPDDCWQFSILIFICSQVVRSLDSDIQKLIDEYRKKHKGGI
ncbi:MAG: hypothetical protein AB1629_07865 [Candidatus Omnitrophota bacterium]